MTPTTNKGPMARPMKARVNRLRMLPRMVHTFRFPDSQVSGDPWGLGYFLSMLLANDDVCLSEDRIRDAKTDGLGCFQIDRRKELGRFYRQIGWLASLEDLIGQARRLFPRGDSQINAISR